MLANTIRKYSSLLISQEFESVSLLFLVSELSRVGLQQIHINTARRLSNILQRMSIQVIFLSNFVRVTNFKLASWLIVLVSETFDLRIEIVLASCL